MIQVPAVETPDAGFYNGLVDNVHCGMLLVEAENFRVSYCNRVFTDLTGYEPADLAAEGFTFLSLMDADHHDRIRIQLDRVRSDVSKRKHFVIYALRHKNGEAASYYLYAMPREGEPRKYQLMLIPESTESIHVPFISYDTREIFLDLFSDLGFGTFEWIIEPDKIFLSEGARRIFGAGQVTKPLTMDDVRGWVHPEDVPVISEAIRVSVASGGSFRVEVRVSIKDMPLRYLIVTGRIIRSLAGEPLKLVGGFRDITRQRESEDAIKRNVAELNRSNRELEAFSYATSHDLQEPLRKISTFTDRLIDRLEDNIDQESGFYLQRIQAAAGNMRQLIQKLLDFARITKVNLSFANVRLSFVLKEALAELELKIAETQAVMKSDPLPDLEADPVMMKQLFCNLIGNSLKFRKAGVPPEIRIESAALSPEEKLEQGLAPEMSWYRMRIADNGIGFEEEYVDRIFKIFHRLHGKSEYPGSGIGLAICKKIVDYHGGVIFAENTEAGASFTIILPARQG